VRPLACGAALLHRRRLLLGNYGSLRRFMAHFQPDWQARYLVVAERGTMPRVLAAPAAVYGYGVAGMLRDVCLALRRRGEATAMVTARDTRGVHLTLHAG
jgi:hypothetical protein